MILITCCPSCGTTFRVQPTQLSVRGGKVRCGKCGTIFNGVAALVEQPSATARPEPSPQLGLFEAARHAPPAEQPRPVAEAGDLSGAGVPPNRLAHGTPMTVEEVLIEEVALDQARPVAAAAPRRPAPPHAASRQDPPLAFLADERPRARFTVAWSLLALIAAAALALQLLLYLRSDVVARYPQARPAFAALCLALECELHLPQRPDLMSIESSDLQADTQRDNVIVLNAVIRNHARFPQQFPSLELTLTDEQDRPVVRRVLAPSDYLAASTAGARLQRGIAAGGEAVARVYFDASRVRATGYRIYLFYP